MLFIKYAPKFLRNLLLLVYILFLGFASVVAYLYLDYYAFGLDYVRDAFVFFGLYTVCIFALLFAFKPIIKKYPKTYIVAYIIDVILLLCVVAIFNS